MNFRDFDRSLEDFRDAVAEANLTMRGGVKRYVAMMEALDSAFALYYNDLPNEEKAAMRAAFDKLTATVAIFVESVANVHELKRE